MHISASGLSVDSLNLISFSAKNGFFGISVRMRAYSSIFAYKWAQKTSIAASESDCARGFSVKINFIFILLTIAGFILPPNVCLGEETHFVFIAGGSASGKTTFAKKLVQALGAERALFLSSDDYLDKRIQPKSDFIEGIPNFDNPSMINWKLLKENITRLQCGLHVLTPIYDFNFWLPVGFRWMEWKPLVIFEGIHVTQDELDSISGLRVFIDVDEDLRYKRRLMRDVNERNYPIDLIEHIFFKLSVPYQKIFLDPTRHKANIMIKVLDAEEYLEKAVSYISNVLETYKDVGYGHLKLTINCVKGDLSEE